MYLDFECDWCYTRECRSVVLANRDAQTCNECGRKMVRLIHYKSVAIGVPAGFKTSFEDVHGAVGSPQREQFEKQVRSGEVVYAGPGSRWV